MELLGQWRLANVALFVQYSSEMHTENVARGGGGGGKMNFPRFRGHL